MKNNYFFKILSGLLLLLLTTGCMSAKNISMNETNVWKKLKIESALNSKNKNIKRYFQYALLTSEFDLTIASDPEFYNEPFGKENFLINRIESKGLQLIIQEKDHASMHFYLINRRMLPFLFKENIIYTFIYFVFMIPDRPCIGIGYISIDEKENKIYFWISNKYFYKDYGFSDFVDIFIGNRYFNLNDEKLERAYSVFKNINEYQKSITNIEEINNFDLFFEFSYFEK